MSFTSSLQSLRRFSSDLRRLPRVLAQRVTQKSAPAITALAVRAFDSGTDPYGIAWEPGADGERVTLRKTGALERYLRYVAVGTKLRVALGVAYAKYQIGKRPVFPRQGGALPLDYVRALEKSADEAARDELGGGP